MFDEREGPSSPRVAIVNDVVARRYFGGEAVGPRITDSYDVDLEIVGVIRSGEQTPGQDTKLPLVYYPLAQQYRSRMTLAIATDERPAATIESVRRALTRIDPGVPVFETRTLESYLGEVFAAERLTSALLLCCAGMALLLASVGLYGAIAYNVLHRSREIGVRIALGAGPLHVLFVVLREGLALTAAGIAAGLALAFWSTHGLAFMLFGVAPRDAMTFALAPVVLAAIAVIAAAGPARRALRVDPIAVLRQE
jgi:predicted lysophospholipase L1 biosynthesis ABC-type transport system permease subunit